MENSFCSSSESGSFADSAAILILQELKMLRKDLNLGIAKMHEEIKRIRPAIMSVMATNTISRNNGFSNAFVPNVNIQTADASNVHGPVTESASELTITSVFGASKNILLGNASLSENVKPLVCTSSNKIDKICEKMLMKQQPATNPSTTNKMGQHQTSADRLSNPVTMSQTELFAEMSKGTALPKQQTTLLNTTSAQPPYNSLNHLEKCKLQRLSQMCKSCGKYFTSYHKLKKHLIQVHNRVNKHICTFCGRSCYNAADLRVHLRIHTGEKPYKCSICDAAFSDKSNYTRHCRLRKNLSCSVCNMLLCTKMQLHSHRLKHSQELYEQSIVQL